MDDLSGGTCGSCGEPTLRLAQSARVRDRDGICLNAACPEFAAGELRAEDLTEADIPAAIASRLAAAIRHLAANESLLGLRDGAPHEGLNGVNLRLIACRRLATQASQLTRRLGDAFDPESRTVNREQARRMKTDLAVCSILCLHAARSAHEARIAVAGIDMDASGMA